MKPEDYKLPQGPSHAPQIGETQAEAQRRQQANLWELPEQIDVEQLRDDIRTLEITGESEREREKRISEELKWARRLALRNSRRNRVLATYVVDTVRGETPRFNNLALRRSELTSMGIPVGDHDTLVRTAREKDRPVKEVRRAEGLIARWKYNRARRHLDRYFETEVPRTRS